METAKRIPKLMKLTLDDTSLDISRNGEGYIAQIGGQAFRAEILSAENGKFELLFEGHRVTVYVSSERAKRWVTIDGRTFLLVKSSGKRRGAAGHDQERGLAAPMPGQIQSVNVSPGEIVKKGQTLLVLEAMKMQIRISAPADGRVGRLLAREGETVERGQVLIEMEQKS